MFNFNTVVIIGTGLLGCSLALALKKYNLAHNIIGLDTSLEHVKMAKNHNIINEYIYITHHTNNNDNKEYQISLNKVLNKADWIVLASPVKAIQENFKLISPYINEYTIISDVGSTKQNIIE